MLFILLLVVQASALAEPFFEGCPCTKLVRKQDCENPLLYCKWVTDHCEAKSCADRSEEQCRPSNMIGSNAEVKDCFRNEFDDDCVDYSSLPACSAVDLSSITDTVVKSQKCHGYSCSYDSTNQVLGLPKKQTVKTVLLFLFKYYNQIKYIQELISLQYLNEDTQIYISEGRKSVCRWADNECQLEQTPYPTYCFNLITESSCGQIPFCRWDSDKKECTHKVCEDQSPLICEFLVYIDKETGGQICAKNDQGNCAEGDITHLDEANCQSRTLNTYYWDGSACSPCNDVVKNRKKANLAKEDDDDNDDEKEYGFAIFAGSILLYGLV